VTFVAPNSPVQYGGQQPAATGTAALGAYVTSTPDQIKSAVHEFMHPGPAKKIQTRTRPRKKGRKASKPTTTDMRNAFAEGKALIQATHVRDATRMPVYIPRAVTPHAAFATNTSTAPNPRRYVLRGPHGHRFAAYRLVLVENATKGQYYGIQGTTWRNPPILAAAHQTRRVGKRTFRLYSDGGRLRLVAWYTPKGVYWVSNTLSQDLSSKQMLTIASSLTRARSKR
jgi:hypothetical protein